MSDGIAKKKSPQKWAAAKARAKAKMGGKHSARAMQLAGVETAADLNLRLHDLRFQNQAFFPHLVQRKQFTDVSIQITRFRVDDLILFLDPDGEAGLGRDHTRGSALSILDL